MFKAIVVGTIFMVGASCSHINIEDLENLIDFEDTPSNAFSLPYPYHGNTDNRVYVQQKPYYESKPVLVTYPSRPSPNEVRPSSSGLISSVVSTAFSLASNGIFFIVRNAPALIVGILTAFGICKWTPICSKLSSVKHWSDLSEELQSLATNDRLERATKLFNTAIRKYRSLQDSN